ncbi:adenylate kinase [Bacteroidales bacterium OttesenSCG-928-B11]|nr:adenylate kinase [Bacteroidales bacterium OttesenSCG-928-C03]MDL2311804.1 adenylate kinase [Bacteroidales bacterium OttesenSCG-928-B11]MDL2326191.1 adenylate kinase [Bacteroidales bacterium OttesenSCG-928-A14]
MKANQPFNIVLLGGPGSGKGTQAKLIKTKYGLEHLSTGALFRHEIAIRSGIGIIAQQAIDKGNYCPDNLTLNMLNQHINASGNTKGFIFDGVPRTIHQAKMMDGIDYSPIVPVSLVIYIFVEDAEIEKRILGRANEENRSDDNPEVIKQRIRNFHQLTEPLIQYYSEQNKLMSVNGMQPINEVFNAIDHILSTHENFENEQYSCII